MSELQIDIISPSKKVFSGTIRSLTVPGTKGSFQILKNHAPIISTFEIGLIKMHNGTSEHYFASGGGTVEVMNNKILLLADSIEEVKDIDIERAKEAKKRAEERLSTRENKEIDVERARLALARALNRIRIYNKYR
ncbi:MAG: F0F1 ATP synthase subunit epsilon [Ignavibacteriaceae bacterium]